MTDLIPREKLESVLKKHKLINQGALKLLNTTIQHQTQTQPGITSQTPFSPISNAGNTPITITDTDGEHELSMSQDITGTTMSTSTINTMASSGLSLNARMKALKEYEDSLEQIEKIEKQLKYLDRFNERYKRKQKKLKQQQQQNGFKNNDNMIDIDTDLGNKQRQLSNLLSKFSTETMMPECIVLQGNEICQLLSTKYISRPSIEVMIPIVWPLITHQGKYKSIIAIGFRIFRLCVKEYGDLLELFYFYFKKRGYDRFFSYPYDRYDRLIEDDDLNVYNNEYERNGVGFDDDTKFPIKIQSIKSKKPNNNKSIDNDVNVKEFKPLIIIISNILYEESGQHVVECLRFVNRVVELHGCKFLDSLGMKSIIKLIELNVMKLVNNNNNSELINVGVIDLVILLFKVLCEITINDLKFSYEYNVLKYLIKFIIESPFLNVLTRIEKMNSKNKDNEMMVLALKNLNMIFVPIILKILNSTIGKEYIIELNFIPLLLSSLLDNGNQVNILKYQHITNILNVLINSSRGIELFYYNEFENLKNLINGLFSENAMVRTIILSIIANGLRIKKLTMLTVNKETWNWEKIVKRSARSGGGGGGNGSAGYYDDNGDYHYNNINISNRMGGRSHPEFESFEVNEFTKKFLISCLKCELVETLVALFNKFEDDKKVTRWISFLLCEIFYLKSQLLSSDEYDEDDEGGSGNGCDGYDYENEIFKSNISVKMNGLIERESKKHIKLLLKLQGELKTNEEAVNNKGRPAWYNSSNSLLNVFLRTSNIATIGKFISEEGSTSIIDMVTVENIVNKLKNLPPDVDIKPLVLQTKVLSTKEYLEWDWVMIYILLRAVLTNDERFEEVLKTTKLFKRLISFYKPQKAGFIKVFRDEEGGVGVGGGSGGTGAGAGSGGAGTGGSSGKMYEMYVNVGVELVKLLLNKAEGVVVLRESGIFQTVKRELERENALVWGYLRLVGVLSSYAKGVSLLEECGLVGTLFQLRGAGAERAVREVDVAVGGQLRVWVEKQAVVGGSRAACGRVLGVLGGGRGGGGDYSARQWAAAVVGRSRRLGTRESEGEGAGDGPLGEGALGEERVG